MNKSLITSLLFFASSAISYASINAHLDVKDGDGKLVSTYSAEELNKQFIIKTMETETPWTHGAKIRYRGVAAADILARAGIGNAASISAVAIDQYKSEISSQDIEQYAPIVATEIECSEKDRRKSICQSGQDYRPLTLADKGPLYLVWPYAEILTARKPSDNHRWVWYLSALEAKP